MGNALRAAAWAGIIVIIISFLSPLLSILFGSINSSLGFSFNIIFAIVTIVLWVLFVYGFVKLGKIYDSKFLKVMAWISIIVVIITFIITIFSLGTILPNIIELQDYEYSGEPSEEEREDLISLIAPLLVYFVFLYLWSSILGGLITILFGVALLKLNKKAKVRYAKTAGILKIISGATYIIFIGYIIRFVAFIFELMMMFNSANELDKKIKR